MVHVKAMLTNTDFMFPKCAFPLVLSRTFFTSACLFCYFFRWELSGCSHCVMLHAELTHTYLISMMSQDSLLLWQSSASCLTATVITGLVVEAFALIFSVFVVVALVYNPNSLFNTVWLVFQSLSSIVTW